MTDLIAPMEPAQLKAARAALGYTLEQMAEALGLEGEHRRDTVRAWESGRNPISGPARVAVRFMLLFLNADGRTSRTLETAIDRAKHSPKIGKVFGPPDEVNGTASLSA